jgi:boron transporter
VRINIPSSFNTTSGRPWLVDFNDPGLSAASKGLAFFPALVLTALYFFDHNVSALLTHRSEFGLKKQLCYDWDFMVLGFMMIVCGVLGLPPCNGLIPNSPMHSKALIVYKTTAQKEEQIREDQQNQIDANNREGELADSVEMQSMDAKNREDELADNGEMRRRGPAQLEMRRNSVDPDVPVPQQRRGSAQLETRRNSLDPNLPIPQQRRGSNAQLLASLQKVRSKPEFDHVVDQRLSNLLQSGMVAIMLLILPVVALVPSCVVTGLFLFMGVESLLDGDIYSRIILPFVEKKNRGFLDLGESITEDFLDRNIKAVHVYTLIQLVAFGIVFYVTQTVASIIFPVIILLLIPLRFRVLPRMALFSRVVETSKSPNDFFDVMDKPLIYSAAEPVVVSADAAANSVSPPPEAVGAVTVGECESGQHSMHEQNISGAVVVGIPPESVLEFRRRVLPPDHPHIGDSTPPDSLRAVHNHPAADSQKSL